jgi:hypothetical protein
MTVHINHERISQSNFWNAMGSLFPMKTEELAAQLGQNEEEEREELPLREMKTSDHQRILSDIDKLTNELCEIDHDWERSASMRPYHDILIERKKKSRQSTLHAFFKNVTILNQGLRQRTNAASLRYCRL